MVLTNPPFGKRSSVTIFNGDGSGKTDKESLVYERQYFWATTSNKQLNFLQHVNRREDIINKTPEEIVDDGYQLIRENLVSELLENVKKSSPIFFERLVVELLVAMGYGGSIKEAGRAVGKTGDEGIDGIIKEDTLGLDAIYIQAKKWEGTIGRPEIQKFAGALQGQRAKKGIFITTGNFSNDAKEYVSKIDS